MPRLLVNATAFVLAALLSAANLAAENALARHQFAAASVVAKSAGTTPRRDGVAVMGRWHG